MFMVKIICDINNKHVVFIEQSLLPVGCDAKYFQYIAPSFKSHNKFIR